LDKLYRGIHGQVLLLYILGHMVWSYVVCNLVGRGLKVKVPAYLALLMGVVPDFDIYFHELGVPHHTVTHSIIVWLPIFLIAFFVFGKRSLPYSAGVAQHFLIGDFLAGTVPLFIPVTWVEFGLNLGIQGRYEAILEVGVLVLAVLMAVRNGDFRSALSVDQRNLLMGIPLTVLVSLTVLFANDNNTRLLEFGFVSSSLTLISTAHILLACFLVCSVLQGIRGYNTHEKSIS
jgi:hypothetical protein